MDAKTNRIKLNKNIKNAYTARFFAVYFIMLSKIKLKIFYWFSNFKRSVEKNKVIYVGFAICVLFGALAAISSVVGNEYETNIILKISEGEFGYLWFFLKVALITAVVYILSWACSSNTILYYVGNAVVVIIATKYIVTEALAGCIADWTGLLVMLAYYLPIFIVNCLVFIYYFILIGEATITCSKKLTTFLPIKMNFCASKAIIKKYLLRILLFNLIYSAFVIVIFVLIF